MILPRELNGLRELRQWVAHQNKIPRNPLTGGNAMANNPETWGTFEEAQRAISQYGFDGIGFQFGVFAPNTLRVSGIDLDHVVHSDGSLEPYAEEIVMQMDSYTELSPSGTGLHILCYTKLPDIGRKKGLTRGSNDCGIEMYNHRHYFTVTGRIYGQNKEIQERTEIYLKIYEKYFPEAHKVEMPRPVVQMPSNISDQELWDKMFSSHKGYEIQSLFSGDTSRYAGDDSRADLALCGYLSFWTGGDEARIDRMFRQSGLMRQKWDEQHGAQTYGAMTIRKAMSNAEFHSPEDFARRYNKPIAQQTGGQMMSSIKNSEILETTKESELERPISQYTVRSYIEGMIDGWTIDKDLEKFQKYSNRKTGFQNIDARSSLYPGLYVLGAISSLGKTTFVHQMADQLARNGEHVLFFSLEQTCLELVTKGISRITAQHDMKSAVSSINIRRGVNTELVQQARQEYAQIAKHEIIIQCDFKTSIEGILEASTRYFLETGIPPIVIVDYVQVIAPTDKRMTAKDVVDSNVRALKKFQRDNDLVVILVSSLNRQNYLTPIDFESFKESGGIEYTADVIWGLQLSVMNDDLFDKDKNLKSKREKVKEAKLAKPRDIEFVCLKNRYGESNYKCKFKYYAEYDYFIPNLDETANILGGAVRL